MLTICSTSLRSGSAAHTGSGSVNGVRLHLIHRSRRVTASAGGGGR
jgi:hypothetical protein